jgi:ABC-type multidrug transport system fused ATPase/permease subunit
MAEIVLDHVSKVYGAEGPSAVSDLNLNVKDGEFIVLVGPSAAARRQPCEWSPASSRSRTERSRSAIAW